MSFFIFLLVLISLSISHVTAPPSLKDVVDFVTKIHNKKISPRKIHVSAGKDWDYEILQSVSKFLFEDLAVVENIAPENNTNRPGKVYKKEYICVHETGDYVHSAGEWSNIVHEAKIGTRVYNASFQYVVGEDGIFHNIPDDEEAYHAGDGHEESSIFGLNKTGVYGSAG